MTKKTYVSYNNTSRQDIYRALQSDGFFEVTIRPIADPAKKRTSLQNAAMHVGFEQAAKQLNAAGVTASSMFAVLREDMPVEGYHVKDVYRAICRALGYGCKTSGLDKSAPGDAWDAMSAAFATRRGVDIGAFPSLENARIESIINSTE